MNVDPDVAALLEEGIPGLHQPTEEHTQLRWGTRPMWHTGVQPTKPSDTFQPERYGHCVWCGEPLLKRSEVAVGYDGRRDCDAELVEMTPVYLDYYGAVHLSDQDKHVALKTRARETRTPNPPVPVRKVQPTTGLFCMAKRLHHKTDHTCECAHPQDHFGFHECHIDTCHRLWR